MCVAAARGLIPAPTNLRRGCCRQQGQDSCVPALTLSRTRRRRHDQVGGCASRILWVISEPGSRELFSAQPRPTSLLSEHNGPRGTALGQLLTRKTAGCVRRQLRLLRGRWAHRSRTTLSWIARNLPWLRRIEFPQVHRGPQGHVVHGILGSTKPVSQVPSSRRARCCARLSA